MVPSWEGKTLIVINGTCLAYLNTVHNVLDKY